MSTLLFQVCFPYNSESVLEGGQEMSLNAEADISVVSFLLILDQYLKVLPLKEIVPESLISGIFTSFFPLPSFFPLS